MLKIYKEDFTVRSYQTDLNARMKPSAILEVMQEAAGQHSERLGLGRSALLAKNTAWVLTRVEIAGVQEAPSAQRRSSRKA